MKILLVVRFLFLSLALHCVVAQPTKADSEDEAKPAVVEPKEPPVEGEMLRGDGVPGSNSPEEASPDEEPDVEKELATMLDRAEGEASMEVLSGMATLERVEGAARGGRAEGAAPAGTLGQRLADYLSTHVLRVKLPGAGDVEEGRGKLKRLLVPFVVLLQLVFATVLFPLFTSGIALLSLYGLWNGLAAGLVAGGVGLSELLSKSGWAPPAPRVTVLRPHVPVEHVYHGVHGAHGVDYLHHGWSRTAPGATVAATVAAAAGAGSLAVDPYRGYGPSSGLASPAAAWETRPVLH